MAPCHTTAADKLSTWHFSNHCMPATRGQNQQAEKQISISVGNVVIMHIPKHVNENGMIRVTRCKVVFPLQMRHSQLVSTCGLLCVRNSMIFGIQTRCEPARGTADLVYRLTAVVCHVNRNHYVTYAYRNVKNDNHNRKE